jgi:hypothetical protein
MVSRKHMKHVGDSSLNDYQELPVIFSELLHQMLPRFTYDKLNHKAATEVK